MSSWIEYAVKIEHERISGVRSEALRLPPAQRVNFYLDRVKGKYQATQLAKLLQCSAATVRKVSRARGVYPVGGWHYNLWQEDAS